MKNGEMKKIWNVRGNVKLCLTISIQGDFLMFNVGDMIYQVIVLGLIVLFVVSFTLFIRSILLNQQAKNHQLNEIEKKMDKIIELMDFKKQ
ncbi:MULTISPECIES: DUF4083 domain-containing protein [Psychrobacillus]|uniref:DUF4083 domain-containing protein n=2 Tax=Bacillaceae TaxID=186817 RepID=UPI0030F87747